MANPTGAVEWTIEDVEPAQESKLEAALRTLTNELSSQRKELSAMQVTMTKLAQRIEQSAATPKKLDQILAKLEGGKPVGKHRPSIDDSDAPPDALALAVRRLAAKPAPKVQHPLLLAAKAAKAKEGAAAKAGATATATDSATKTAAPKPKPAASSLSPVTPIATSDARGAATDQEGAASADSDSGQKHARIVAPDRSAQADERRASVALAAFAASGSGGSRAASGGGGGGSSSSEGEGQATSGSGSSRKSMVAGRRKSVAARTARRSMVRQKSLVHCATTATKSTMARLRASADKIRASASLAGLASASLPGRTSTVAPHPHNDDAVRHWKDIGQRVVDTKKQERKAWMKMLKGAVAEQRWGTLLATRQANEQILGSALRAIDSGERFQARRERPVPPGVLLPSSPPRLAWDIVSIILVSYITVSLPYRTAFLSESHSFSLSVFDFLIDVYFLVDIVINFRTAFLDDGELVTSPYRIGLKYLTTWFFLDLAASLPIEWFLFGVRFTALISNSTKVDGEGGRTAAQLASILKVFKVLKLLKLLRLARLLRYFSNWQEYIQDNFSWLNSNVFRLMKLSVMFLVVCHWNACIQFFVADLISYPADSWVVRGGLKYEGGDEVPGMGSSEQYSYSFFCSASQMLALDAWNGAGDFRPIMMHELWGNLLSITAGSMLYALLVASLTAVISEADPAARAYRAKVDTVNHYMRYAQLPRPLRSKLRDYLELAYPAKCAFDEDAILDELTAPLRQEVHLHKCARVLETLHVIHTGGDPGMPGAIAAALEHVCFVVGDYILRQGTRPDGMYFLSSGTVDVVTTKNPGEDETLITTLSTGSFFGEMALLSNTGRAMASIRVTSSVEGHYLSREQYKHLVENYPTFKTYLSTVAKLRLESREERGKKVRASRWRRAMQERQHLAEMEAEEDEGAEAAGGPGGGAHTLPDQSAQRMQAIYRGRQARAEVRKRQEAARADKRREDASAAVLQKAARRRAASKDDTNPPKGAQKRGSGTQELAPVEPQNTRVSGYLVQSDESFNKGVEQQD